MTDKKYEIIPNFYDSRERRPAANGIFSNDCHHLAGRTYRALRGGLFANSNLTEAEHKSYEGDSVEGKARQAFFDQNDIVRWKSNGVIPFGDMLLDFFYAGYITKEQLIDSAYAKELDNEEFWKTVKVVHSTSPDGEEIVHFVPERDESGRLKHSSDTADFTNQRSVAQ